MINHNRIKQLNINPERIRELIEEIEEQEVDVKKEMEECHKKDNIEGIKI